MPAHVATLRAGRNLMTLALLALAAPAQAATPFAGLEWRPLSRADLTWVNEERTSGLAVGEFDGTARPALSAFVGAWFSQRVGLSGALGVARLQNTTLVDDTFRQRHWGVLRPSIDLRIALTKRAERRATPWLLFGLHGDIPSARDVSDAYTEEEQVAADETASTERARLGGVGARVGAGADYRITEGVSVGGLYAVEWHRAVFHTDDTSQVSSWLAGEASLLLVFEWPPKP